MDLVETLILQDKDEDIARAAEIIKNGGLVAFPTETVYGLGADAFNSDAVSKIYLAKGRPSDNPMIVHIGEIEDLNLLTEDVTDDMKILMNEFWPGPMTLIVRKRDEVPHAVTGGLNTVGVRFPKNPVARKFIKMSGCPIAAPSANLSGRPSPTAYSHVEEDMSGRIDAIIESSQAEHGIESSVIDMTGSAPVILRPGVITREMIQDALGKEVTIASGSEDKDETFAPRSPGMKYKHYAPRGEMKVFIGERSKVLKKIEERESELRAKGLKVKTIVFDDEVEAAHDLFSELRKADQEEIDVILAAGLPENGLGVSVMNRMFRSAGYNIEEVK